MGRSFSPAAKVAILTVGLAWAVGAAWVRLAAGWSVPWVTADGLPGVAFLVAGFVAWSRRPDTRIGPLLTATGFAWYVGTYGAAPGDAGRLAHAFQGWYEPLLAWLVLAYPSGRLGEFGPRAVIGAFFAVLGARAVARLAMNRPNTAYDLGVPAEVERYISDMALRDTIDVVARGAIVAAGVAVLVLVVWRLRRESAAGRRVAGPILLGGIAVAVGMVVEWWSLATAGSFAERSAAWDVGQAATVVTMSLVPVAFLAGLVRGRLARGAVADLVVDLGGGSGPGDLRAVLARALRDPSLEVAYPSPAGRAFADAEGRRVELPPPDATDRAVTRLEADGATLAVLVHDAAVAEESELLRAVSAAALLAVRNELLAAEVEAQLAEVRASRARIVAAGDAERRRVERDLHDGAQQRLVTLALALQVARSQADAADPALGASLERASSELSHALSELRELARGLHPPVLTEEGLGAAVAALADRVPVAVRVTHPGRRYPAEIEAAAYFVVAEALTNVVKHAAASVASVTFADRDGWLTVEVTDDGAGGADPTAGSGLSGLVDRVAAAGGRFVVCSEAGRGTTVRAELPCA